MDTKMKGLFKGLRYISQIFDSKGEPEMQIGFPTDVKHVAHIGWDGPTPAPAGPTWMNEFQSGMEGSQHNSTGSSNWANSGFSDSSRKTTLEKPPSRPPRHKSSFTEPDSPPQRDIVLTQSGGGSTRHSSSSSVGSPSRDIQTGSKLGRKSRSAGGSGDSQPSDAPPPTVPKQKNRRKVKGGNSSGGGGSSGGSVRSSRSRPTMGPAAEASPELNGPAEEVGRGRPQRMTSAREGDDDI